jgi:major type 1 subunit fimbrin (pilin)
MKTWRLGLLVLFALIFCREALADCSFTNGNTTKYAAISLPGVLMTIPRDNNIRSAGTILWDSGWVTGGATSISCSGWIHFIYGYTAPQTAVSGLNRVYETGIPGIGMKVGWYHASSGSPPAEIDGWIVVPSPAQDDYVSATQGFAPQAAMRIQLVATGAPLKGGVVTLPSPLVRAYYGSVLAAELDLSSATISVQALSCVTPDVLVNMQEHLVSGFTGQGSKVGTRDFDIQVNGCPAGIGAISYSLESLSGTVDASQGVMALQAGPNTAVGVGIQITDRDDNPVQFDTKLPTTGYNSAIGGSFTIPLRASYYQTAPTVLPGRADGYVALTMSYE